MLLGILSVRTEPPTHITQHPVQASAGQIVITDTSDTELFFRQQITPKIRQSPASESITFPGVLLRGKFSFPVLPPEEVMWSPRAWQDIQLKQFPV